MCVYFPDADDPNCCCDADCATFGDCCGDFDPCCGGASGVAKLIMNGGGGGGGQLRFFAMSQRESRKRSVYPKPLNLKP